MRLCVANFLDDLSLNHWVVRDGKLIQVRALQSRTTEENMFNVRDLNPNEEFVQIGDKRLMPVIAIGSVLLRFVFLREGDDREHKAETQVENVRVVPGMGFNLFSGWRVSVNGHAVSLHADCLLYTSPSPRD